MSEEEWWFECRYGPLGEPFIGECCIPINCSEREFIKEFGRFIGRISNSDKK